MIDNYTVDTSEKVFDKGSNQRYNSHLKEIAYLF